MRVGKQGDNQEHVQAEWDLFVRLLTTCFEFAIQPLKRSVSSFAVGGYVPAVPASAQDILAMAQTRISELQRLQFRMEAQLRDRRLREWKASLSEGYFRRLWSFARSRSFSLGC